MAKRTVSIRLDQKTIGEIDRLWVATEISRSRLIETIIEHFLAIDLVQQRAALRQRLRSPKIATKSGRTDPVRAPEIETRIEPAHIPVHDRHGLASPQNTDRSPATPDLSRGEAAGPRRPLALHDRPNQEGG